MAARGRADDRGDAAAQAGEARTTGIAVTVPATELLREQLEPEPQLRCPALLDGKILVDTAAVRGLAANAATWERLFTHPVTGLPVTVDTYTPTRAQRRWLRARDGRCRWPGCAIPVSRADLDHALGHADGGRTVIENLASHKYDPLAVEPSELRGCRL